MKPWDDSFTQGLESFGYRNGVNAVIDIRSTVGSHASPVQLAESLVALNPDVIFVAPAALAQHVISAVEKAGTRTPVVVLSYDPVLEGVVTSASRRAGNITGLGTTPAPELMGRHLQLLQDMLPSISRVVYLVDTTSDAGRFFGLKAKSALDHAGAQAGVRVSAVEVANASQLNQAFAEVVRAKPHALIVPGSPLFNTHRNDIIRLAAEQRLPAIYGAEVFVRSGGLMSYWTSVEDVFRRAAAVVDQVLRGTPAGEIPVEYPTRFRLVINLKTANALGLRVSEAVLIQADEIIR